MTPGYWLKESDKLRDRANTLRNSGTSKQNMTPRRKRIYEGQLKEAEKLDDLAACCIGMADESRPPSPYFVFVRTVNHLRAILEGFDNATLNAVFLTTPAMRDAAKKVLIEMVAKYRDPEQAKADEIKKMELELVGLKIPGFFPTPPDVVELMIRCADIGPDVKKILEPSAGKGDLIAAAQKAAPWAEIHWCEHSHALVNLLTKRFEGTGHLKARDVDGGIWYDFLKTKPDQSYDLVLMNPPFESGQDVQHVIHAFKYLKPNGRLVAIMSEGPFFRSDKLSEEWRQFAAIAGAYIQKLPAGSFKSAFVPTGVNTRLVVIDASQKAVAAA